MSHTSISPEERFALIVGELLTYPGVTPPADGNQQRRGFGSSALRIHDKIFAMLSQDRLVVKLPKARVDALVAAGEGERFDPRRDGRLMKEWLVLEPTSREDWLSLTMEGAEFVGFKG